jgi:hypothetical protein
LWVDGDIAYEEEGFTTLFDNFPGDNFPEGNCNMQWSVGLYGALPGDSELLSVAAYVDNMSTTVLQPTYTYHLSADGSGDYPTIQDAVDVAPDCGGRIVLAAGRYTGNGNRDVVVLNKSIEVISASGDPTDTIIDPEGSPPTEYHRGFMVDGAFDDTFVLSGVTIENGFTEQGGAIWVNGTIAHFRDCVFQGNKADDGMALHCVGPDTTHVGITQAEITNCWFVENGDASYGGAAVTMSNYSWITIDSSLFVRNVGGDTYCIKCVDGDAYISGCTFRSNSGDPGQMGNVLSLGDYCFIDHSIIAENDGDGVGPPVGHEWVYPRQPKFSCCDIWGNDGENWDGEISGQLGIDGNLSVDPMFCDENSIPPEIDFSSPCSPHHPDNQVCGLIGGLGVEYCGPVRVDETDGRGVEIGFRVAGWARDEATRLSVYDVGGRQVRRLVNDRLPEGMHRLLWDGRDDNGGACPSGIYLLRLRSGNVTKSRTVVLVQ